MRGVPQCYTSTWGGARAIDPSERTSRNLTREFEQPLFYGRRAHGVDHRVHPKGIYLRLSTAWSWSGFLDQEGSIDVYQATGDAIAYVIRERKGRTLAVERRRLEVVRSKAEIRARMDEADMCHVARQYVLELEVLKQLEEGE